MVNYYASCLSIVGLEVLPCRFETTSEGVKYLGLAELRTVIKEIKG